MYISYIFNLQKLSLLTRIGIQSSDATWQRTFSQQISMLNFIQHFKRNRVQGRAGGIRGEPLLHVKVRVASGAKCCREMLGFSVGNSRL